MARKKKSYNSRYRKTIIRMILQGKNNKEIWMRLDCHEKLPQITRRWWERLPEDEKAVWLEEIAEEDQPPEDQAHAEKQEGFNTPYKSAKGRFVYTRY